MVSTIKKKFLNESYEHALLQCVIGTVSQDGVRDTRYGQSIIGLLDSEFFSNQYRKDIVKKIKEYYETYREIPSYNEIKAFIALDNHAPVQMAIYVDELKAIAKEKIENRKFIEDAHVRFFTQQAVLKFCYATIDNIKDGKTDNDIGELKSQLNELEKKLYHQDRPVEILPDVEYNIHDKSQRASLGWGEYFDNKIKFKQGRMALGIVPTGVGKTTLSAITAVHNFLQGKKVLLVFFEDYYEDVVKKIYAKLSSQSLDVVELNSDAAEGKQSKIFGMVNPHIKMAHKNGGSLTLIKKDQTKTSVNDLRQTVDRFLSKHGHLDFLILDYLDCLNGPEGKYFKDMYQEQAHVIIDVLTMISDMEYYVPCLSFVQTNRSGLNKALVELENTGGSIDRLKKAQLLFTVSKTLEQKSAGTATFAVWKNRDGEAGIVFDDCILDNGKVHASITESNVSNPESFVQ